MTFTHRIRCNLRWIFLFFRHEFDADGFLAAPASTPSENPVLAHGLRRVLLTCALSNSLRAMIFVLSFISAPGPEATHSSSTPHDGPGMSHGLPEFWHLGPFTFGEASPKLDEANAATNGPCARTTQHTSETAFSKRTRVRFYPDDYGNRDGRRDIGRFRERQNIHTPFGRWAPWKSESEKIIQITQRSNHDEIGPCREGTEKSEASQNYNFLFKIRVIYRYVSRNQ